MPAPETLFLSPMRDHYEYPEMIAYIAGHIRAICRYPSGQARLGVEEARRTATAAVDAMRGWNHHQRKNIKRYRQSIAPAPGEKS